MYGTYGSYYNLYQWQYTGHSCVMVGGELMIANSYVSHNGPHALGHKQKLYL